MIHVITGGAAILMATVQVLLTRAVSRAASGGARGALLSLKLTLWAAFFMALGVWARDALLLGGGIAMAGYLVVAFWWMLRLRKEE